MRFNIDVATKRGVVLNGVLFRPQKERAADTAMIAITGIHGNFCSNPFYYNRRHAEYNRRLRLCMCDAFSQIFSQINANANTGKYELIGSWNERFCYTDEDFC